MNLCNAYIKAVGGYIPPDILSNQDLENTLNTTSEWILERTGIQNRHIACDSAMATSSMATLAIENLFENYAIDRNTIDCLLLATATPDYGLTPTSSIICENLNLKNVWATDLNGACCGFLHALTLANGLIKSRMYKNILVVGADKMSSLINYEDRNTSVLFGDGAGCILLSATDEDYGIIDVIHETDGKGTAHLLVPNGGSKNKITKGNIDDNKHFLEQNGKVVFKHAIETMSRLTKQIMNRNQLTNEIINWIVPHQANLRIIKSISENVNIPLSKFKINIEKYGNTTSATIPLCLWDFKEDFKKNDTLVFSAFGAGFNGSSMYLKWK